MTVHRRRARRTVHAAAAAAVHHRLRDPRHRQPNPTTCCRTATCAGPRWTWRRCGTPRPISPSWSPGRRSTRCGPGPAARGLRRAVAARAVAARRAGPVGRRRARRVGVDGDAGGAGDAEPRRAGGVRAARGVRVRLRRNRLRRRQIHAPAVRQIAHRAREHVQARRKRFEPVDPQARRSESRREFFAAAATGDVERLMAMLAPDVVWTADSDGKASAARRPVVGAEKVASWSSAWCGSAGPTAAVEPADLQQRAGAGALPRRPPRGRHHASRSSTAGSPTSTRCATPTSWPRSTVPRAISR